MLTIQLPGTTEPPRFSILSEAAAILKMEANRTTILGAVIVYAHMLAWMCVCWEGWLGSGVAVYLLK